MKKALWIALLCLLCLGMIWNANASPEGNGIVFSDAILEQKIRVAIGKPEGPITSEDAAALTWLDARGDQNAPEDARIRDISALRYFVNLTGIMLDNHAIHDISPLAELPNLRGVWLLGNSVENLEPLSMLTGLVQLSVDCGYREMPFLKNLTNLEELRIDKCRVLPPELAQLRKLKTFCSLGGELTDISLLARLPGLTVVDISWNQVKDLTPLKNLPLTELYLQGNHIEDYSPIRELYPKLLGRNFEYIELRQPENPDEKITFADPVLEQKIRAALGKPKGNITTGDAAQVTILDLHNEWQMQIPRETQVTSLQGMEAFINLRELSADFNVISDISVLSSLTELRKLSLGGNAVSDISPLGSLVKLEDLTLFGNGFKGIGLLSSLTELRRLHLGGVSLPDISALAPLTKLDSLYLGRCGIWDISPLAGMTNMYTLELSDNYITDLSPLAGMTKLVRLKLANNPIRDYSPIEGIYPKLQEKDFEYGQVFDVQVPLKPDQPEAAVPMPDAGLEAILRDVTGVYDRPLTQQDMCGIGKFVIDMLKGQIVSDLSALRYCLNLEGLVIWSSTVSDLTPLSGLTRLRVLTVSHSLVSDVTPLKSLTNLEQLDVTYNQITDLSPLYGLQKLSVLKISHNMTQDASGFKGIAKGLKDRDFEPDKPMEQNAGQGENAQPMDPLQPENPDKIIKFSDKVLEKRIREAMGKPEGPITAGDAAKVTELYIANEWQKNFPKGSQITNLNGIEYFINLQALDISFHKITDLTKLSGLTQLTHFKAFSNVIESVKPLAGLVNLTNLNVGSNKIKSVKPLIGLQNLTELMLDKNPIADFSPLAEIYPRLTIKDFGIK
jgi:internalin A